jgi:hypothetical protein
MIAQDKTAPDSFYHKAVANTIALHHHAFGKGSSLYNGAGTRLSHSCSKRAILFLIQRWHPMGLLPTTVPGMIQY